MGIVMISHYYSTPQWSIAISLSVCLSVREHISGTAVAIFTKFFVQIPCAMFSPPLAAL